MTRPFRVPSPPILLLAALSLGAAAPGLASAQGAATAALQGMVIDSIGTPVAGADVVIRHVPTGAVARTTSGSDGRYHVAHLRPGGPYHLEATRIGLAPWRYEGIQLQAGATTRIDVRLGVSAVAVPGLEILARLGRFGDNRMGQTTVVDSETLATLPTVSGNVMDFAALSPMAIATGGTLSIAGQNHRMNALQIDGALSQDVFGRAAGGMPGGEADAKPLPLQAVEQYQVVAAPFDVRQSGFTGGVLNVVTRGGTNRWEGSAHGFLRDHRLMGEVEVDGVPMGTDNFRAGQVGLSVGGPLRRDLLHLFVAAEFERKDRPTTGFSQGSVDALRTQIAADSVARFLSLLASRGFEPGTERSYPLSNPTENLFARLDWRPRPGQRVTVRVNHAAARQDVAANRQAFGAYEISSTGYGVRHRSTSTALERGTRPGTRLSNEVLLNLHRIQDDVEAGSTHPGVEVDIQSRFEGGVGLRRRIRAGSAPYAQANELDQSVLQLRNDLTASFGRHVLTLGASVERFGVESLLVPGSGGVYGFESLAALEQNRPSRYARNLLQDGTADPRVRFSMVQLSAYLQDEWEAGDGLTLQLGLRVERTSFADAPRANPEILEAFGKRTEQLPGGDLVFTPRMGFRWQNGAARPTQLRGGAGLFAGRPPVAWFADAFANDGLGTAFLVCEGAAAPGLVPDAPPTTCVGGAGGGPGARPHVTFFADDFRFPLDLKVAVGADQQISRALTATVDAVYTRSVHQLLVQDVNLADPVADPRPADGWTDGFGFEGRDVYGRPTLAGFEPLRRTDDFGSVLRISDDGVARALSASLELELVASEGLVLRGAYTLTRSVDRQSLSEADAVSNFGVTPAGRDPNNPGLSRSSFDRPQKVLLSAWTRVPATGGTEASLVFTGQSGLPYSYVYASDVNADGYPGNAETLDRFNDLVYVPAAPSDFPGSLASTSHITALIGLEPCLAASRGGIMERNSCRSPWVNRLDLRLAQTLRVHSREVRIIGDVVNLLNLLNRDWGRDERVSPTVPVLQILGRQQEGLNPLPTDPLMVGYVGPLRRDGDGRTRAALPYHPAVPASQWQAQLGLDSQRDFGDTARVRHHTRNVSGTGRPVGQRSATAGGLGPSSSWGPPPSPPSGTNHPSGSSRPSIPAPLSVRK